MIEINLTPNYRGLWISKNDFALLQMWKKENGFGKILENYGEN